jgi:hypothetical protein
MLSLVFFVMRHGKPLPAPCPTPRKYLATVFGAHSLSETVFISSLPNRRLICSFLGHLGVILKGRQR